MIHVHVFSLSLTLSLFLSQNDLQNHERQLEQVETDLKDAIEYVDSSQTLYPSLEGHYLFYQQMRGYLRDLLSCLAVKVHIIVCYMYTCTLLYYM